MAHEHAGVVHGDDHAHETQPGVVLSLEGANYAYLGKYPALDDVTLSIDAGEAVLLLGPNGGGKSTLLKVLAGLVFPDSGVFRAFGQPVTEDALEDEQFNEGFRSRLGFVFQNTEAQLFSATVREEIAFGPLNMGLDQDEVIQRTDDLCELFGLFNVPTWKAVRSGGRSQARRYGELLSDMHLGPGERLFWRLYSIPHAFLETAAQFLGARSNWKVDESRFWRAFDRRVRDGV